MKRNRHTAQALELNVYWNISHTPNTWNSSACIKRSSEPCRICAPSRTELETCETMIKLNAKLTSYLETQILSLWGKLRARSRMPTCPPSWFKKLSRSFFCLPFFANYDSLFEIWDAATAFSMQRQVSTSACGDRAVHPACHSGIGVFGWHRHGNMTKQFGVLLKQHILWTR